jgi:hypothetical protein
VLRRGVLGEVERHPLLLKYAFKDVLAQSRAICLCLGRLTLAASCELLVGGVQAPPIPQTAAAIGVMVHRRESCARLIPEVVLDDLVGKASKAERLVRPTTSSLLTTSDVITRIPQPRLLPTAGTPLVPIATGETLSFVRSDDVTRVPVGRERITGQSQPEPLLFGFDCQRIISGAEYSCMYHAVQRTWFDRGFTVPADATQDQRYAGSRPARPFLTSPGGLTTPSQVYGFLEKLRVLHHVSARSRMQRWLPSYTSTAENRV